MSDSVYWARKPAGELADEVTTRFKEFTKEMERTGRTNLWASSTRRYHGQDNEGGYANSTSVSYGGEQGELALVAVNHYRSLIQTILSMVTSQRPAFKAMATTDDHEAAKQVSLAEAIWEYELDEGGVEDQCHIAAERSQVLGEGWVYVGWNPNAGEITGIDPGEPLEQDDGSVIEPTPRPIRSGALEIETYSPADVARRTSVKDLTELDWVIVRKVKNRWDLAAIYAENAEEIVNSPYASIDTSLDRVNSHHDTVDSAVEVLELYHERTPAVPNGRHTVVLGDIVLFDGPLPYRDIPIYCCAPSQELGVALGYSGAWDLLAISQVYDSVMSNLITVSDAGAIPNWLCDRAQQIDVKDLEGRLGVVEYTSNGMSPPPGLLEGPRIDRNAVEFARMLEELQQRLSGVAGTMRGSPEKQLESGAALALLSSLSLQYNTSFQRAYAQLLRAVGTAIIHRYQRFLTTERLIEVAGRDEAGNVELFQKEDLRHIKRIRVELGNPLLRTMAGKEQVASTLLERFPDKVTPEQFLGFLTTGRLEPIWRADGSRVRGIREEGQRLLAGEQVIALATDYHEMHIREHTALLDRSEVRYGDQSIAMAILNHVKEHAKLASGTDPGLLLMTGQRLPDIVLESGMEPPEGQGGPPPGPEGQPPPPMGPGGSEAGPVQAPQVGGPDQYVPGAATMTGERPPQLPRLPTNPLTGRRA